MEKQPQIGGGTANWRFGNWLFMLRDGDIIVANCSAVDGVVIVLPRNSRGSVLIQTSFERELESIRYPPAIWESAADGILKRVDTVEPTNCAYHLNDFNPAPDPVAFVDTANNLPQDHVTHHGFCFEQGVDEYGEAVVHISHPLRTAFSITLPATSRGFVFVARGGQKQLVWSNRNLSDGDLPGASVVAC